MFPMDLALHRCRRHVVERSRRKNASEGIRLLCLLGPTINHDLLEDLHLRPDSLEAKPAQPGSAHCAIYHEGAMIGGRRGKAVKLIVWVSFIPCGGAEHTVNSD